MDRVEAKGFGIAVVGHAALLAALTWGLTRTIVTPPSPPPMEVSFVDDVALTAASPQPSVAPPAPSMAPEAGPTEDPAPAPVPAPTPPTPRRAEPAPSPERAEAKPVPTPPRAAPGTAGTGERTRRSLIGDDLLRGIGRDPSPSRDTKPPAATVSAEARASINQAITRALLPCQRQPLPAPEASAIRVQVHVTLARDGGLIDAEATRVLNDNPNLRIYEQRMRDLALAVIRRCTPIRGLPANLYDVPRGWRQFNYTFDPRLVR